MTNTCTGSSTVALSEAGCWLRPSACRRHRLPGRAEIRVCRAQQVAADDARLITEYVEIPSPTGCGSVRGYHQPSPVQQKPLPYGAVITRIAA